MLIGIDASRATIDQPTGTERYARALTTHLLTLPAACNHQWRLYTDSPGDAASLLPTAAAAVDAPSVDLCALRPRLMWTHRALGAEVRARPPDVLFVPAHVLPFTRGLPRSVVTIHDVGYRYFPEAHTRRQRLYLDLSTRWSVRRAQRVICVSAATAADVSRFYGRDRAGLAIVHEAADPQLPPAPAMPERYNLGRPYAFFIGTIQPRKNISRMLAAYAQLIRSQPVTWDLVLAGKPGWLSERLYRQARKLGLEKHVHFLGFVPQSDAVGLMQQARFLCFPSLFEGFGLPVLEAQHLGVPVMTANNSALPEVAGEGALYVDPHSVDEIADAMLRLSQDEELRTRLIRAGHANARRFSWRKAAEETLAVLVQAADGG